MFRLQKLSKKKNDENQNLKTDKKWNTSLKKNNDKIDNFKKILIITKVKLLIF